MKIHTALLLIALSCCAAQLVSSSPDGCSPTLTRSRTVKGPICKGALIFEDNFDTLDMSKWSHEVTMAGGGNNEFQTYWEENSITQDGTLRIQPGRLADKFGEEFLTSGTIDLGERCTASWNNGCVRTGSPGNILPPATSSKLMTSSTFTFTYGTVEVRAKLPAGDWLWPAIWLMPKNDVYGGWPTSGNVDIVESRGNRNIYRNGTHVGVEYAESMIQWGPDAASNARDRTHWERNTAQGQGYDQDFHLFQYQWTPDNITLSLDNVILGTVTPPAGGFYELGEFANQGLPNPWINGTKMAPFDQEFFVILSVAVGGTSYFSDDLDNLGGKPWTNNSTMAAGDFWSGRAQWENTWRTDGSTDLVVDYVRVWAL